MQLASYNLKATEKIVAGSTLKIGDNKLWTELKLFFISFDRQLCGAVYFNGNLMQSRFFYSHSRGDI